MRREIGKLLRTFAQLGVAGFVVALLALTAAQRSTGEVVWWVELSRYLPYYWLALIGVVALGVSLKLGRWWVAASLGALLLLSTSTMQLERHDGDAAGEAAETGQAGEHVRVMTFNVKAGGALQRQDGVVELAAEVARHDPDIVVMQDADGLLVTRGAAALADAPSLFGLPHVYALGQYIVASRFALRDCGPGQMGYADETHRYLRCTVDVRGTALDLVTAHFLSPRGGLTATRREGLDGVSDWQRNLENRLSQSRALAHDLTSRRALAQDFESRRALGLTARPRPVVVAGDLNAPERSRVVQNLLDTGLRDAFSAGGRGYGFSYGQKLRWGLAFLRIDHILVSPEIGVADCFAGDGLASEHRPVIADLVVGRSNAAANPTASRPE